MLASFLFWTFIILAVQFRIHEVVYLLLNLLKYEILIINTTTPYTTSCWSYGRSYQAMAGARKTGTLFTLLYFKHIVISIWEWVSMYFVPISHQTRTSQQLSNLGSDKLYLLLLIIILYISNSRCIRVARNVLYSSYFFWAMLKSASRHLLIIYFKKKL